MKYALSIDWLSLFCESDSGCVLEYITTTPAEASVWGYEHAPHGTRQYKELITVTIDGEDIFEVQQVPCSHVLRERSMIIKVCNRYLYSAGLWHILDTFLSQHNIRVINISRVDLCADFNEFYRGLHPLTLIKGFLNSTYRHIGRGIGSSHFNHFAKREGKVSISQLNYTGLSFGSNESAARVYLYNKSFELLTVKDKPWIRQLWKNVGLENTKDRNVWRLEISIKSKGTKFKDKATSSLYKIDLDKLHVNYDISVIYHTFVKSLFSFIRNRIGITNISREPRLQLFNGEPCLNRCVLAADSAGNRTERVLIKQLWQLSETYRGREIVEDEGISKTLAAELAANTNLLDWLHDKSQKWAKPKRK